MSNQDFVMSDAPLPEVLNLLNVAGIVTAAQTTATGSIRENRYNSLITFGYDVKVENDDMETWIAIDEQLEPLTEEIFEVLKTLPYRCLRTPTLSDPEERVYEPRLTA